MGSVIIALVMGWALERTNIILNTLVEPGITNENAGFGAVEGTLKKMTLAPAAYRVLVPWLILGILSVFKKAHPVVVYQAIRTFLMALMFWSLIQGWNLTIAAVTGVILVITIRYDYWDWPVEITGIALAMTGNIYLALAGGILSALSRETAPLLVVVYWSATGDIIGSAFLGFVVASIMLIVRKYVGPRALHCPRFTYKVNWAAVKRMFMWHPWWQSDTFIMVAITILAIAAALSFPPGWMIIPVVLASSWIMAKHDEVRVLASCIPFIAAWLVGL